MRRLDVALIARNPGLSRRKAQDAITKGQVSVSGSTVDEPGAMVADDANVTWDVNRKAAVKRRISLPVLYRDEHLLVVDKPAGLLSVPTDPDAVNEDSVLRRLLRDLGNPGRRPPFVGAVHRIDRGTSGALVFALDAPTRTGLRSLFRAHRIVRHYGAIVVGAPGALSGVVNKPIRDAYISGRRAVARDGEAARDAITQWRVVEDLGAASLLDVTLATGRQHQIRIHLAHIGLPVAGDNVYGRDAAGLPGIKVARPMLHAHTLGFRHPATGAELLLESPWPADFVKLLRRLRSGTTRGPL